MFQKIFSLGPVQMTLEGFKKKLPILELSINKLLEIKWDSIVDFKLGMDALFDMKLKLDELAVTLQGLIQADFSGIFFDTLLHKPSINSEKNSITDIQR